MVELTEDELAWRAGTTASLVRRMAALGILSRREAPYPPTDIARVRLVQAFESAGIDVQGIGRVVASGQLSFTFVDSLFTEGSAISDRTYQLIADELGLSMELIQRIHVAMGLPRPMPDDRVRHDDAAMIPLAARALGVGLPEGAVVRTSRVYGDGLRRLAEAGARTFDEYIMRPLAEAGLPEQQVMDTASRIGAEMAPQLEPVLLWLFRRHNEQFVAQNVIQRLEALFEREGVPRTAGTNVPAIVFLDLSGYTRLTEERGDEAAAELALTLAELVQEHAHRHGGRPVKWLGDGVMFHFPDPARAVVCSLDMMVAAPHAGLPSAHVGIDAGPVVARDGDYYGRTVNVAARIAGQAGPDEVLVSEEVLQASKPEGVDFEHLGAVALKGVAAPVTLYRATRPPVAGVD